MRKILWILLAAIPAWGQVANPPLVAVSSAPSGSCSGVLPAQIAISTGIIYTCQAGTWGAVSTSVTNPTFTSVTIGSGGTEELSGAVSTFPGIWLGTNAASPSTTNYAILTDGSSTLLNSPASSVSIRIANSAVLDSASTVITAHVPILATGTQTVSGCSLTSALGGSFAGSFHSGTSGTCTVTITPGNTATNGFSCWASDLTTTTDRLQQTGALSATTATITGTTVSGDIVTWGCVAF